VGLGYTLPAFSPLLAAATTPPLPLPHHPFLFRLSFFASRSFTRRPDISLSLPPTPASFPRSRDAPPSAAFFPLRSRLSFRGGDELNETEGDAAGRDAAALWWGEKSERLAVFNGGRGERRARGDGGR